MRGRPRKPTPAKILSGTFRKDRENPDEPKPEPPEELKAPEWLDEYGRECWDKYVPRLVKTGILTSIDMLLFAGLCERWSTYRRAIDDTKINLTHSTESNGECAKPQVAIAKLAFDQFCRGMAEFGCSPASRGKVKAVPPTDDDPVEKFFNRGSKIRRFLS
jgi:P27 family predicted phage terminase small subunit